MIQEMRAMPKKKEPGYGEALEELESIIGEIESESVDVDVLTEKVKRATFLIGFCKERLKATEVEVKKALEGLEAEEPVEEEKEDEDEPGEGGGLF
jgi:exodeoxyribonuclease VII small subunit